MCSLVLGYGDSGRVFMDNIPHATALINIANNVANGDFYIVSLVVH